MCFLNFFFFWGGGRLFPSSNRSIDKAVVSQAVFILYLCDCLSKEDVSGMLRYEQRKQCKYRRNVMAR